MGAKYNVDMVRDSSHGAWSIPELPLCVKAHLPRAQTRVISSPSNVHDEVSGCVKQYMTVGIEVPLAFSMGELLPRMEPPAGLDHFSAQGDSELLSAELIEYHQFRYTGLWAAAEAIYWRRCITIDARRSVWSLQELAMHETVLYFLVACRQWRKALKVFRHNPRCPAKMWKYEKTGPISCSLLEICKSNFLLRWRLIIGAASQQIKLLGHMGRN